MDTLPSSIETLTTSRVKTVETCKVIRLRSGKECEIPFQKDAETSGDLPEQDTSEEKEESDEELSLLENKEENADTTVTGSTSESVKQPEVVPKLVREKKFV